MVQYVLDCGSCFDVFDKIRNVFGCCIWIFVCGFFIGVCKVVQWIC